MVGLADLKKHLNIVKKCNMSLNDKYCYFSLSGVNTIDFLDIVNYKSWVYKTFQKMVNIRYIYIIKKLEKGNTIVRTSVGFAPLLLRYLKIKGYQIRDEDIEVFKARNIVFPDFRIKLYDFQERMINDWLAAGSIGVLKSPTGSGKCVAKGTLILTNNGLIKIEDIVKRITDSKREDKDNCQLSLYDTIGDENNGEKFLDDENIKNVDSIVSVSSKLKYETYDILARYDKGINSTIDIETSIGFRIIATPEHKIVVIDKDGNLRFKRLDSITNDDYIAITYNTNRFNEKLKLNYCFRPSKYDSNARFMTNIDYMNEGIARLLGYAVSEGTDYGNRDNNITSFDKEMVDDMISIIRGIGLEPKYVYREDKNDGNPIGIDIYSKSLREFFYYLGYRHGSRNKEVPWSILQADRNSQIAFMRALFDGDGTLAHKDEEDREDGKKYAEFVSYASSSYELCKQLQIMLLNIGIISRLKRKKGATLEYRGELRQYEESYNLHITGGEILKFTEAIGFGLRRKQEKLDKIVETLNNRERWTNIVYPNIGNKLSVLHERLKILGSKGKINKIWVENFDLNGKIVKLTRKRKLSSFQYLKELRFRREMSSYIKGDIFPSKITLNKILEILNPDMSDSNDSIEKSKEYQVYLYLKKISDMFIFDKVEKIKEGNNRVYDITVDNVHSYIGNGIVNHNTIIGCNAIKRIGRKTLILVHTSDLLINVWNDSLLKSFGPGIMGQVGIIGGGLTDRDRAVLKLGVRSGDFDENIRKDIVIATFQTLMNRIDDLTQYKFGLMMVDECIPIDSEIWTQDGIIQYEDLGYGQDYKRDVFQVWSRDDEDNIVNNGYKKIKTRMKDMYRTIVETGDELVCSLDHKVLTKKSDGKEEFVEIEKAKNIARSLIRPYDMKKESILARIFGYVLGDGNISFYGNTYQGSVCGDYQGLSRMTYDIRKIDYRTSKITEIETESIINTVKYGEKFVHSKTWVMNLNNYLTKKLADLGCTVGKKTDISFKIPDWIMKGNVDIKREFLGGYFGADGSNPDFRGNEDNKLRRSFYVNRFSISKRSDLVENGVFLASQIEKLLSEFNIKISSVITIDSNIRKDGSISRQILSTISNNKDNLLRFLDIGYRYCYEKEKEGEIIRLYFKYISECDIERKEINKLVIDTYKRGNKSRRDLADKINKDRLHNYHDIEDAWEGGNSILKTIKKKYLIHVTGGIVSDILYPHNRNGVDQVANQYRKVLPYDMWLKKVKGDFIFLDILRHEYRGYEQGYTLTVTGNHNYLNNGFDSANCHHVPANMFRKVNAVIRAPYKLGLSATTTRLDGMEKDCFGQLGDIRSKVSIRELINRGILAEPRFQSPIIVDRDIIDSIQDSGLAGLNYSRLVKKKSASSQKKKDFVVNICKNIAARDRKFLLFTDYVNAEDVFVRDMYADSLLKEGTSVSVIDQGMASDERSAVFNFLEKGDISGIIFGKLGSEGVNIPSVDVVVMANAIKCISGDTLIPTDKGIVRAEDLDKVKPNSVFTIDPDNGSVITAEINEFYSFDEEDTIRIGTIDGHEIEGSISHRIITEWSHGNVTYTPLSDVHIGSNVLICGDICGKDADKDKHLIFYDRVISKKKGKNKLYDMNVDKYHSFIAGGFVNHNSPITFTQRVGRAMRRIPGKDWCDVYEVLLDLPTEMKWSHYNFAEYSAEGFQKLVYKVE